MMNYHELDINGKLWRQVFKFILPAITAMAVSALYNIVDRIL